MGRQRSAHEGNIRKRSDGRWETRVDFGYQDGKRVRRSFYGRTRAEVSDQLVKVLRDKQQGLVTAPGRQTTRAYLAEWLENTARPRLRPRTFADYKLTLDNHVLPFIGAVPLAKLTPQRLQKWIRAREVAGVSAARCRYVRTVLRTALAQAVRWQLLAINPAALIQPPRHVKAEIQPLNLEQAQRLLAVVRGHELEGFVTVALACGLRIGEALALFWTDIDLEQATLTVRRTVGRVPKALLSAEERTKKGVGLVFSEPKSKRSRRTLSLPAVVVDALRAHRMRQREQRLALGPAWQDSGLVFTSPIGTVMDHSNLRRQFLALLDGAEPKLPRIRCHDLRHTCATLLLAQGVDPRTIMETLGHSQISLTLDTYAHVLPQLKREAANRMDALFARA